MNLILGTAFSPAETNSVTSCLQWSHNEKMSSMHSVSTQVEFGVCCSPFLGACVDLLVAERSLQPTLVEF